ncbi:MAG TPA: DUF4760 domain-containing protein [Pyrinomonadaceae bacterium]|nr:DUF4760 domain-containing protein [Pyrinomonadaceae bacterium]
MSKQEDANLILKLYDLRREAVMREARTWFFTFNPTSVQDFMDVMLSDKSAYYRMVLSYWEMAAALVNNGAIDEQMFADTNGEHLFIYGKIQPFIPELRKTFGMPEYMQQLEKLVKRIPDIETRFAEMRERIKAMMAMREERAKAQAAAN